MVFKATMWNLDITKGEQTGKQYIRITKFRNRFFSIIYCYWGEDYRSLYVRIRYIEVLYFEVPGISQS